MLSELFYWVMNMSIIGAVTGAIIVLLRIFKDIPRRVFTWLWAIPFLRFIIPFGISNKLSLIYWIASVTSGIITVKGLDGMNFFVGANAIRAAKSYFPIVYKSAGLEIFFKVASIIWVSVAVIILSSVFVLYFLNLRQVKKAEHYRDNIYLSDDFKSPSTVGVFRPKIIVPRAYLGENMDFILAHEKMHIRYLDNFWRIIACIICCIQWFNPFSWIFFKLFLKDIELACDERVLSSYKDDRRKQYGNALLDCVEIENSLLSSFGGAGIKKRIYNILSYKRLTVFSTVALTVFIMILSWILLTNGV